MINRLHQNHGDPLVARYDHYERTTVGPRLPHLFQRDYGSGPVIGTTSLRQWLKALFVRMELRDRAVNQSPDPHDFFVDLPPQPSRTGSRCTSPPRSWAIGT